MIYDLNCSSCLQGHLHIIDVSQAVDLDHPRALDFLREDCVHVSVSTLCWMASDLMFRKGKKEGTCIRMDKPS